MARKRKQFVVSRTTGYIIIGFFVIVAVFTVVKSYDPDVQARNEMAAARSVCKEDLEKKIADPGSVQLSVQLDEIRQWAADNRQNGTVLVQPTGRMKNESGTVVQVVWECVVKNDGFAMKVTSLKQR